MADPTPTHLSYPFTWGFSGNAQEIEQDTIEEIVNCCEVVIITPIGALTDQPDFGITDPLFKKQPDLAKLSSQINNWEPRAAVQIDTALDTTDEAIRIVQFQIATRVTQ